MCAKSVVNLDITDADYMVREGHWRGEYFALVDGSACEVMVTMRNIPGSRSCRDPLLLSVVIRWPRMAQRWMETARGSVCV